MLDDGAGGAIEDFDLLVAMREELAGPAFRVGRGGEGNSDVAPINSNAKPRTLLFRRCRHSAPPLARATNPASHAHSAGAGVSPDAPPSWRYQCANRPGFVKSSAAVVRAAR